MLASHCFGAVQNFILVAGAETRRVFANDQERKYPGNTLKFLQAISVTASVCCFAVEIYKVVCCHPAHDVCAGGAFDPLGWSKGNLEDLKVKELKNGRLAMLAFLGFIAQYGATGQLCPNLFACIPLCFCYCASINNDSRSCVYLATAWTFMVICVILIRMASYEQGCVSIYLFIMPCLAGRRL